MKGGLQPDGSWLLVESPVDYGSTGEKFYSEDQPRVPAGEEGGGRWTSEGGAGIESITPVGEKRTPERPEKLPWPPPKFRPSNVTEIPRFTDIKESKKPPEREAPMAGYEHEGGPMFTDLTDAAPGGIIDWEDRHIDDPEEHFLCILPDGKRIELTDNDQSRVRFTGEQVRSMKNGVGTHNHPRGGWGFSDNDIDAAIAMNLAEMRCVGRGMAGEKIVYSLMRPPEGWPSSEFAMWEEADKFDRLMKPSLLRDARLDQAGPLPRESGWRMSEGALEEAERNGLSPLQYANLNFRYFHEKSQWISDKFHMNYKREVRP